jgi:hypothetical protein
VVEEYQQLVESLQNKIYLNEEKEILIELHCHVEMCKAF